MLKQRRVLVVEDEVFIACWIEDMLVEAGATVIGPAATVTAALHLLDAALIGEGIDAAVLDYNLGGFNSFPVALALAKRGVPFLVQTAYLDVPTLEGVPLISKPYKAADLISALGALVV